MSGRWKIKHEDMRRLALEARDLCAEISDAGGSVDFEWIPREKNKAADALSNDAMDGKSVHRVVTADGDGGTDSAADAGSPAAQDVSEVVHSRARSPPAASPARPGAARRRRRASHRRGGASPRRRRHAGRRRRRRASRRVWRPTSAAALDVEAETSGDWSGQAPGEGADETVRTAYHSLAATGGTVVAVTSRRGVLSVLSDVLGTPVGALLGPGHGGRQPHRGGGLGGRVRVGGFHQSDRPSRLTDAVRYSGHELCR